MLAIVRACAFIGLDGCIVEVETDFNPRAQIPSFTLVGLPDSAVKESRERVRAAIKNSHLQFINKTCVVNLSLADLPKHVPSYDLSIAIGVLAATDQVPLESLERSVFIGELSLDGSVRHVKGVMPMVYAAYQKVFKRAYVPSVDAPQAALVEGIQIIPFDTLGQLVEHLYALDPIAPYVLDRNISANGSALPDSIVNFSAIKGLDHIQPIINYRFSCSISAGDMHIPENHMDCVSYPDDPHHC
jgi:magnesium chelatase family protein